MSEYSYINMQYMCIHTVMSMPIKACFSYPIQNYLCIIRMKQLALLLYVNSSVATSIVPFTSGSKTQVTGHFFLDTGTTLAPCVC